MKHGTRVRFAVVALVLSGAVSAPGGAQTVAVGAVRATSDHGLLGGHLDGVAGGIGIRVFDTPASLRIGADWLSGSAHRRGVTCFGLVVEPCDEYLRDDAHFTAWSAGVGLRVVQWRRFALDVAGDFRRAKVHVDTRLATGPGGTLTADKAVQGVAFSVGGSWVPWARTPLALEAGVTTGNLQRRKDETLIDGYSPFERDFKVTSLRLGVAWRRGSG